MKRQGVRPAFFMAVSDKRTDGIPGAEGAEPTQRTAPRGGRRHRKAREGAPAPTPINILNDTNGMA